jgi:hypothetical protein
VTTDGQRWVGSAEITPQTAVRAGERGTWTIDYLVGIAGIDDGGRIRLSFRTASDWSRPQFSDPVAADYVSTRASRPVTLTTTFGRDGIRPWSNSLTVRVSDGALGAGDRVTVVLGDRLYGGPGMRAQTFSEKRFRFRLQADPFGAGIYQHVAWLGLPIVGSDAARLIVTTPSDTCVGEETWLHLRAVDVWGNVAQDYRGVIRFDDGRPHGLPETYRFTAADGGVHRFEGVRLTQPGVTTIGVTDEDGDLAGRSNPIRCHVERPAMRRFWGDLHGQTEETVGTGSIADYFTYARDVAAVDATAHQGNDFQITAEVYRQLTDEVERSYEPGRFVTFHGYEWSGNTPAGGDHNVHYLHGGPLRRSSHTLVEDTSDLAGDCYPIDQLYAANVGRDDVLITPHIGGRRASLDYHVPELERVIEIASQWGRFEWFAHDALERGLCVGFIGGSDDHSGRPGWSAPTLGHHGVPGALTAFLATELSREALWDALRSRRCYGTTGPRILLDVTVDGHPIGADVVATTAPKVRATVVGVAPIDSVELRRGTRTVATWSGMPEPAPDEPWRVRVAWRGARNRDRGRALDWTGALEVRGGRIIGAENYAIDNPLDGIIRWEPERVAWRSHTCGDWDGVILDLDGDDETELALTSPSMRVRCTLADLLRGPVRFDGPGLEQRIVVQRLSRRAAASEVAFIWRDEAPAAGVNPYWIWVTQTDGEMAWSSPIFVTWNGGHRSE